MKVGHLFRHIDKANHTIGFLIFENCSTVFAILERPDKGNKRKISRIPSGIYKIKRDYVGRFQWWKVLNVRNRSFIEIHEGNKSSHSQGCLLVGLWAEGDRICSSRKALRLLQRFLGNNDWTLVIHDPKQVAEYQEVLSSDVVQV